MNNCTSTSQRTVQPITSTIDNHQSTFINPAARAASKPKTSTSPQDGTAKPFDSRPSSVDIHQSNRESHKQAGNVNIATRRHSQTLRQSAIVNRHSSILPQEPQASRKRQHRHKTAPAKPFDNQQSSIDIHQSCRKSHKQAGNVNIATRRHSQTLRQSAIVNRHSSILPQEPQASRNRQHRHKTAQPKPFDNQQSSIDIHQSCRKSRKQAGNVNIATRRHSQTLRQSAIVNRHSSILPQEPQASRKRQHRHKTAQPIPSTIRQSSIDIHQSCRKSRKQAENVNIATRRHSQTLRQSAIVNRHSSILPQEPQASRKRQHRHKTAQPITSTIDTHQSTFINPIARAASKPESRHRHAPPQPIQQSASSVRLSSAEAVDPRPSGHASRCCCWR